MTKIKYFSISIFCIIVTSCNTPVMHPWQPPGDDCLVGLDISQWPIVSQDLYVAVPKNKILEAEKLLEHREYIELPPDQEKVYNKYLPRPKNPKLTPYLIRGVTMGTPYFSIIKRKEK